MGRNLIMLGMAILIVLLIALIVIGFMSGISNPLPWISLVILAAVILQNCRKQVPDMERQLQCGY